MNKPTQNPESLVWRLADLLRGSWKQHEYQDVILPLLLLKRIDTMLEPTRSEVRRKYNQFNGKTDVAPILRATTKMDFYNTSEFDFDTLLDQPSHIAKNFQNYIDGYSENIQDIIAKFDFAKQLERLEGGNILYEMIKQLNQVDLSPSRIDNHEMGTIFENLLRRFSEQSNETAGEHYTPRDVVGLLAELLVEPDKENLKRPHIGIRIYDPAVGTAGILSVVKQIITEKINPKADVYLYGQELNPQTYAIAKADMLIKGEAGDIRGGDKDSSKASTLSNDQFFGESFDYISANPPYGVDWKKDKSAVEKEAERGYAGRFGAGTPRISDGQLLFLQHMVSKMRPAVDGGSRVGIVLNGSPLFTGSAGSGESEIRRWLLEKDLVETIVALPDQLFYNTGISTYIWILTNRKTPERKHKVQLIDARKQFTKRRKSLGNKRKDISEANAQQILEWYNEFKEGARVKIFDTREFGYRQVTIERPLQLSFQVTPERIELLRQHKLFEVGKKKPTYDVYQVDAIFAALDKLTGLPVIKNQGDFLQKAKDAFASSDAPFDAKLQKVILQTMSESDDTADIITDSKGNPEADSSLRDTENVPLGQDVSEYFEREVVPYVPNAWINTKVTDHKDGEVGKVGYEIPFTRFFYEYKPPRDLHEIESDIKETEVELAKLLKELTA
ncbi:SAM-dependent DNA methyltransferase [Candidatus Saccharibacteria bacterium]|nr:SAM-dependent DNA methyltransferase [Candidatus Saccharibacteria bacterium]